MASPMLQPAIEPFFQFELMGSRRQELEPSRLKSFGTQSTTHWDRLTQAQVSVHSGTSKMLWMHSCALVCMYVCVHACMYVYMLLSIGLYICMSVMSYNCEKKPTSFFLFF